MEALYIPARRWNQALREPYHLLAPFASLRRSSDWGKNSVRGEALGLTIYFDLLIARFFASFSELVGIFLDISFDSTGQLAYLAEQFNQFSR